MEKRKKKISPAEGRDRSDNKNPEQSRVAQLANLKAGSAFYFENKTLKYKTVKNKKTDMFY